jgi:hypothetical protein
VSTDYVASFAKDKNTSSSSFSTSTSTSFPTSTSSSFSFIVKDEKNLVEMLENDTYKNSIENEIENRNRNENENVNEDIDVIDQIEVNSINFICYHFYYYFQTK